MTIKMRISRRVNPILTKAGYKIVSVDPKSGRSFTEEQLLRALTEISAFYNNCVFNQELATDEEDLVLLSNSMFTQFGTGLYLIDYLRRSLAIEGDVCEFGVAQGAISALIAHEIMDSHKNLWLFDSFQGFPELSDKDLPVNDRLNRGWGEARKGALSFPEYMVRARLSDISFPPGRTRIIPGFIEKTILGKELPQTVCFAYVDFDLYNPILITLQFLDTVLQPGGFIIIDDYGFFWKGAKLAVDEFYNSSKENYTITVPEKTGGNFCILAKKK